MSQNPGDPNQPDPNQPGQGQPGPDQPPPPPPSGEGPAEPGPPDKDARTMALLGHLLGIVISVLGPLIIWLIKKDEQPFVDDQGKEAMNFQITALIGYVAATVLSCLTMGLGGILVPVIWVIVVIFAIIAAVRSNEGERYRYPVALRLIK